MLPEWDSGLLSMFSLQSDLIFEVSDETAKTITPILPLVNLDTFELGWTSASTGTQNVAVFRTSEPTTFT